MSALLTFACLTMVNSQQYEHGYVSELAPVEPKSQREASNSPQSAKWKQAEKVELKTIWDMGTFLIIDRPKYVIPLPICFTYKLKVDESGNIT